LSDRPTAQERWERYRERLISDLGDALEVIIQIPGWEPVGLNYGMHWLQSSLFEGFQVDHEIERSGSTAKVIFRIWED
jgi:hypothetical protein